ncbi:MAG: hypothetical protein O2955_04775 [Planctomycetota bacterium]|nr:hypothetical protein [Planctomycetota bacterium]MDA1211805.1 hypothetical protein [Planctomycetota bacterium]
MAFTRRIIHYAADATTEIDHLSDRAIAGCWFELLRQGGCGRGELSLHDAFVERHSVALGDWLAFEYDTGERWYLGRVDRRQAHSPAGISFALQGMSTELRDVFPGGFSRAAADGTPPHRYGRTDVFSFDPDYSDETIDSLNDAHELVSLLLAQYVVPQTHIQWDAELIEAALHAAAIDSIKFRGEDSAWSIVQELAYRSNNASWGVDEQGEFFFLRPRSALMASYREAVDVLSLTEFQDRELIFNRVLLVGDYIYGPPLDDAVGTRNAHRWQGNYIEPSSRGMYGDRRLQLHVPWIRSQTDAREFIEGFFRIYAEPSSRYRISVRGDIALLKPWEGRVEVLAQDGSLLVRSAIDRVRVLFDHVPVFQLELGPADPRDVWTVSSASSRWELPLIPAAGEGGELVSNSDEPGEEFSSGDFVDTPCCSLVPAELYLRYQPTGEEVSLVYDSAAGAWLSTSTLPMPSAGEGWWFTFQCTQQRWQLSASNGESSTKFRYPLEVCPVTSILFTGNPNPAEQSFSHIVHDGSL